MTMVIRDSPSWVGVTLLAFYARQRRGLLLMVLYYDENIDPLGLSTRPRMARGWEQYATVVLVVRDSGGGSF